MVNHDLNRSIIATNIQDENQINILNTGFMFLNCFPLVMIYFRYVCHAFDEYQKSNIDNIHTSIDDEDFTTQGERRKLLFSVVPLN